MKQTQKKLTTDAFLDLPREEQIALIIKHVMGGPPDAGMAGKWDPFAYNGHALDVLTRMRMCGYAEGITACVGALKLLGVIE